MTLLFWSCPSPSDRAFPVSLKRPRVAGFTEADDRAGKRPPSLWPVPLGPPLALPSLRPCPSCGQSHSFLLTPVPGFEAGKQPLTPHSEEFTFRVFHCSGPPPIRGNPCPICMNRNQRAALSRGQSSLKMRTPKPALAETRLLAAYGVECSTFLFHKCSQLWRNVHNAGSPS